MVFPEELRAPSTPASLRAGHPSLTWGAEACGSGWWNPRERERGKGGGLVEAVLTGSPAPRPQACLALLLLPMLSPGSEHTHLPDSQAGVGPPHPSAHPARGCPPHCLGPPLFHLCSWQRGWSCQLSCCNPSKALGGPGSSAGLQHRQRQGHHAVLPGRGRLDTPASVGPLLSPPGTGGGRSCQGPGSGCRSAAMHLPPPRVLVSWPAPQHQPGCPSGHAG